MQTFDSDLVSGKVVRSVWKLAWPLVMTQIISGLNSLVAIILVGQYVGAEAIAGVGVSFQVFLVMIAAIISLLEGMAIFVARYAGRKDTEAISRLVYETFLATTLFLVVIVAPLGYVLAPTLMGVMNAEPEVQVYGLPFLRVLLTGCTPVFLLLVFIRAFQASGDPKTPMLLGLMAAVCNFGLNVFFVAFLKLGAVGVAWGAVLGPVPSVLLAFYLILSGKAIIKPPARYTLIPDLSVFIGVARIGIPTGITAMVYTFSGAVLTSVVGTLEHSAASQAALTICFGSLLAFVNWGGAGLGQASNALIGQNIGAGETERGKQGVYTAAAMGMVWAGAFALLYWFAPGRLLSPFGVEDPIVFEICAGLLKYLAFASLFFMVGHIFTGGLMGAGDTLSPMYIAIVSQFGVLLGFCLVVSLVSELTATTVWLAVLLGAITRGVLPCVVFLRARWVRIEVALET